MMVTGTFEEVDNYQNLVVDYPLTDSSPLVDSEPREAAKISSEMHSVKTRASPVTSCSTTVDFGRY